MSASASTPEIARFSGFRRRMQDSLDAVKQSDTTDPVSFVAKLREEWGPALAEGLDVLEAVQAALADGKITIDEVPALIREISELFVAIKEAIA